MKDGYSIIIPAYNEENSIKTLLDGIFKSDTLKGVEVIVVDDNSKDRTTAFASAYPVILIKNVSNSGYGYSLKRGIIAAKHNNIIILDADSS
jgi:glycosyltransferase involved in cell wall biosynthesis